VTLRPSHKDPHCHVCGVGVSRQAIACNRHRHAAKRNKRERPCAFCGTPFSPYPSATSRGSARFCSLACYRKVAALRPAMIEAKCPQCGASFRRTQAAMKRVNRSFCSLACATAFNSGPNNTSWRGGADPNRGQGWRKLAEEIRERDGHRCRRCGKPESLNKQKLSVDYVIPWRMFASEEEANQPSNLVSLCRPCHSRKGRAERLWLQGDVLDMWQYQIAVAQPWTRP
jgi:uncharacterized C2H2 Zn-finger protein